MRQKQTDGLRGELADTLNSLNRQLLVLRGMGFLPTMRVHADGDGYIERITLSGWYLPNAITETDGQ